jgi:hypothetical protein
VRPHHDGLALGDTPKTPLRYTADHKSPRSSTAAFSFVLPIIAEPVRGAHVESGITDIDNLGPR